MQSYAHVPRHCIISTATTLVGMTASAMMAYYWKSKPTKATPHVTSTANALKHVQETLHEEEDKLRDLESALIRAYDRSINNDCDDEEGVDGVGVVDDDNAATMTADEILTIWKDEYKECNFTLNLSEDITQLNDNLERLQSQVDDVATVFDSDETIRNLRQQKDRLSTWLVSVMGRCEQLRKLLEEANYQSKIAEKEKLFDDTVKDVQVLSLMTALEDTYEHIKETRNQSAANDADGSPSWKISWLATGDDTSIGDKRLIQTTESNKRQLLDKYRRIPRHRDVTGGGSLNESPPTLPGSYAISQFNAPRLSQGQRHWLFNKLGSNEDK